MKKHVEYFNYIQKLLEEVLKEENTNLEKAISLIVQKIKDRKSIFIFYRTLVNLTPKESKSAKIPLCVFFNANSTLQTIGE